jgi:hypothetical protein
MKAEQPYGPSYLFESAEECCQFHFQWELQECRRNSLGPPKWYPDFEGEGGCKSDGKEPLFMKRYADYLFETQLECCEHYYDWNVEGCMNPALAGDPCSSESIFTYYEAGYNKDFLLESEVGYYPICK